MIIHSTVLVVWVRVKCYFEISLGFALEFAMVSSFSEVAVMQEPCYSPSIISLVLLLSLWWLPWSLIW